MKLDIKMTTIITIQGNNYTVSTVNMPILENKIIPVITNDLNGCNIKIKKNLDDGESIVVLTLNALMNIIFKNINDERQSRLDGTTFVIVRHKITKLIYGYYFLSNNGVRVDYDEKINIERIYYPVTDKSNLQQFYNLLGDSSFDAGKNKILPKMFGLEKPLNCKLINSLCETNNRKNDDFAKKLDLINDLVKYIFENDLNIIHTDLLLKYQLTNECGVLDNEMVNMLRINIKKINANISVSTIIKTNSEGNESYEISIEI